MKKVFAIFSIVALFTFGITLHVMSQDSIQTEKIGRAHV